jgi:hypothetical protein
LEVVSTATGATEEYNGTTWATSTSYWFKYSKIKFSRYRYTNSWFSFWWYSTYYRSNRRIRWSNLDNKSRKFKYSKIFLAGWYFKQQH